MLVPIKWITDYTDVVTGVDEFVDRMVMSGSNLECVEYTGQGISGVVTGRVLSIEQHPNADKLVVCKVDVGREAPIQIVCGAANLFVGAVVPVCLDGAHIPGPLHGKAKNPEGEIINAGELRGVKSEGMLCGCTELGFDDKVAPYFSKDGIWILDDSLPVGEDLVKALDIDSAVVDFEITPNRPDCLSMIGMAREASAVFGTPLKYPETRCTKVDPDESKNYISVEIKRPDLCKRYCCRVIKDIKIEQSPWWLQKRLMMAGQRPINNIVDLTNFVMLEYGQPMHAFDIKTVRGGKIIVDTAPAGTKFQTLNGQEWELDGTVLTINDAEGPSAVAGIMGGLDSEITDETKMVLVESATFNGDSIRRSSKKLGLRTEASSRFEKGIDPNLAKDACDRFCYLVELLGAGTVLTGDVDVYPVVEEPKTIDIRASRMRMLMGIDMSTEEMCRLLAPLEIKTAVNGDIITVTAPTVRQDLAIEEDYVEELARMYGYDRLPVTIPKMNLESKLTPRQIARNQAKQVLLGIGFSEIQTYSFVSPKALDRVMVAADSPRRQQIKLINPLGEDTSVMRTMLLPNMMTVLNTNYSRSIDAVRFFELGNTFYNNGKGGDGLPEEREALCVACYGKGENFYTLKGAVEELLRDFGVKDAEFVTETSDPSFHPGRCAKLLAGGEKIAVLGQVYPDVAEGYGIDTEVYAAEIDFDLLCAHACSDIKYAPLPKYPAMVRDFAMVVAEEVKVGDLQNCVRQTAGELLEDVHLFDVYRGAPVPPGFKSVALSLTYRAKDRTLKEGEVNEINTRVLAALAKGFSAALREI
ncbi:MAG: phenylalanine--tRNA ligase subunit beta [Firmicutes bacterium]|nr:phenylalanine--tRNA ligase subunit beta [Bacillota bacterium]